MRLHTIQPADLGQQLTGFGLNLLVSDVRQEVTFLTRVFAMQAFQVTRDFALLTRQDQIIMLHQDATYTDNTYLHYLPDHPPRGAGAELHLYHQNPDSAQQTAPEYGGTVIQAATDKPHGLREAYILSPCGYCWVPSVPCAVES